MKNLITTLCTLAIVGSADAQTSVSLIDDDFSSGTLSGNSRVRSDQANGNFFVFNNFSDDLVSDWTISGGVLSNEGTAMGDAQTEGAVSQVIETSGFSTDLTSLTLSFDYEVGATARLRFALIGYTMNLQDGQSEDNRILLNNGTPSGSLQNNTQAELRYGDINLFTGADMSQSITDDLTFEPGTSGSSSVTIDLTAYEWDDDELATAPPAANTPDNTPGLSGSITSIADFDLVVLVAVVDLESDVGVTATTIDNISLTATNGDSSTIPNIIAIELDASGNVVLTLDGSENGLVVQQSNDLATGFADVDSSSGPSTLTIDSADVDPNADGTDFYRIRD